MAELLVRYFAAAAEAAGCEEQVLQRDTLHTVGDLVARLRALYGTPMARVLASGSLLIDGVVTADPARALGERVDVLPPFAGG